MVEAVREAGLEETAMKMAAVEVDLVAREAGLEDAVRMRSLVQEVEGLVEEGLGAEVVVVGDLVDAPMKMEMRMESDLVEALAGEGAEAAEEGLAGEAGTMKVEMGINQVEDLAGEGEEEEGSTAEEAMMTMVNSEVGEEGEGLEGAGEIKMEMATRTLKGASEVEGGDEEDLEGEDEMVKILKVMGGGEDLVEGREMEMKKEKVSC